MNLALLFLVAATLRGPADVATLTAASDAVVHARVVKLESAWGAGGPSGGLIFTRVTLKPIAFWKGEPLPELAVRVPGGAVGEIDQLVQGVAKFGPGEEVVIFLRKAAPGLFTVERWALGKFSVASARAVRDRSGLFCLGCAAGEADALPLDELRARVRSVPR